MTTGICPDTTYIDVHRLTATGFGYRLKMLFPTPAGGTNQTFNRKTVKICNIYFLPFKEHFSSGKLRLFLSISLISTDYHHYSINIKYFNPITVLYWSCNQKDMERTS